MDALTSSINYFLSKLKILCDGNLLVTPPDTCKAMIMKRQPFTGPIQVLCLNEQQHYNLDNLGTTSEVQAQARKQEGCVLVLCFAVWLFSNVPRIQLLLITNRRLGQPRRQLAMRGGCNHRLGSSQRPTAFSRRLMPLPPIILSASYMYTG